MKNLKTKESKIRSILLEEDPGGVYIRELKNTDEYDLVIEKIINLLKEDKSEEEFLESFSRLMLDLFDETKKTPRYKIVAKKIWDAYSSA